MKGMAFGKFNLVHPGHIRYLEEAKKRCDELVVVVATDKTISEKSVMPEEQRRQVIEALKPVDRAILGGEGNKFDVLSQEKPDIVVLGPDQDQDETELEQEKEKRGLGFKVVRVPRLTNGKLHKASKIVEHIKENV